MTTVRLTAAALDLSRLPAPDLLLVPEYEAILALRMADLKSRFDAVGVEYDVGSLETDPGAILEQVDAARELVDLFAINDAARARMLAYAAGTDLDHIAALFGVARIEGELDERFRRRVQLAPDAYGTAGSQGAYIFHALTADLRVIDAMPVSYESGLVPPGSVLVSIYTPAETRAEVMANVRARLFAREIKPLTTALTLMVAPETHYTVAGTLLLRRGPDPSLAIAAASAALTKYTASRQRIGVSVALNGIRTALMTSATEDLEGVLPTGNVDPGPLGVAICNTAPAIGWRTLDG